MNEFKESLKVNEENLYKEKIFEREKITWKRRFLKSMAVWCAMTM